MAWLGHFYVTARLEEWNGSKEEKWRGADYVIYVDNGLESDRALFREAAKSINSPLLWVGAGTSDFEFQAVSIRYRGQSYPESGFKVPKLEANENGEMMAEASDGSVTVPLVIRSGNRWVTASNRLDGVFGYIVSDLLHDFLNERHREGHSGYVMVQNIHPATSPQELKKITDLFGSLKLPFIMAVTPVYRDPVMDNTVYLQEAPELLEVLKAAVENGGSVVLAGLTHQYGAGRTGISYEFWDVPHDTPIPDEEAVIERRTVEGIALLLQNGIQPVGFKVPLNAISRQGYSIISQHFSALYSGLQQSDRTYSIQRQVPFQVQYSGMTLYPENLGSMAGQLGDAERLAFHLKKLMLVRDSMVGVTVKVGDSLDQIRSSLLYLKQQPINMLQPAMEPFEVKTAFATIRSDASGAVETEVIDKRQLQEFSKLPVKDSKWLASFSWFITWGIALVVSVFVIFFVVFLILLNRRRRYRLFAERRLSTDERK